MKRTATSSIKSVHYSDTFDARKFKNWVKKLKVRKKYFEYNKKTKSKNYENHKK